MAINIPTISEKFLDNNGQVNSTWYNYLRTGGASNIGDVLPNFFIVSGAYIQESNYWLNLSIDNGWLSGDTYQGAYADLLKLSDASSVNIRFITSDARATEIATYGESGAFVLDTNNKRFKIPMVTKSIGNLSTLSDIGTVFGNSAASGTATYAGVKFPFFMKVGNKTLEASTVDLKKEAADQKAAISSLGQAQLEAISSAGVTQIALIEASGAAQVDTITSTGTIQYDAITLNGTTWKNDIIATGTLWNNNVSSTGSEQVGLVETAGTTQLGLVNTAGDTQVGLVNSAGATQVGLVEGEGDTQVARVISEGTSYVTAAQNWAIKIDGPVSGSDYSSKYNANLAYTYAQSVNPDNIVHIAGIETITGVKNFSTIPTINSVNIATIEQANPVSTVIMAITASVPDGYLYCNGAAVSRTTYAALFAKIGTLYGVGDGSTTFSLPDFRGRFLRGYDGTRSAAVGTAQGDGLPNITGYIRPVSGTYNNYPGQGGYGGALYPEAAANMTYQGGSASLPYDTIVFNAAYSNAIYGSSPYVTPYNHAVYYYIKY